MFSFALKKTDKIGSEKDAAQKGEEHPKWRKGYQIDQENGYPEEKRDQLAKPKHHNVERRSYSALSRFKIPFLLVIFS